MNRLILETNTLENALNNITFTKQSSVGFKIKIFPSNVSNYSAHLSKWTLISNARN